MKRSLSAIFAVTALIFSSCLAPQTKAIAEDKVKQPKAKIEQQNQTEEKIITLDQLEARLKDLQEQHAKLLQQADKTMNDIYVLQGAIWREKQMREISEKMKEE